MSSRQPAEEAQLGAVCVYVSTAPPGVPCRLCRRRAVPAPAGDPGRLRAAPGTIS